MNNQSRDLTVSRDSFQTQRAGQSTSHTSQGVLGEELYSRETSEPSRTSFPEASVSAPWRSQTVRRKYYGRRWRWIVEVQHL